MRDKTIDRRSQKELLSVIIFATLGTLVMIFLNAYERFFMFIRMYEIYQFGEVAVFFPSYLAIGITYFSYRRIKELESEIIKRKQAEIALRDSKEKYLHLSITDNLTQLYNSRFFYQRLQNETDRAIRYNHPISIIMLDVDDFKNFNDKYGHLEGDHVLTKIGKVLLEGIRKIDSAYRYGGEEFTLLLPETDLEEAVKVAERIRKKFGDEIFSPGPDKKVHVTVSVGVSEYQQEEEIGEFIKRADNALYLAKKLGKDQVCKAKLSSGNQYLSPVHEALA